jgi:predicted NAD/FAD-binding protein
MPEGKRPRQRVAVVGSGLAGLTAAYLLQHDSRQRYEVIVFESVSTSVHTDPSVSALLTVIGPECVAGFSISDHQFSG